MNNQHELSAETARADWSGMDYRVGGEQSDRPKWRKTLTLVSEFGGVVGGVALVASNAGRRWLEDASGALYPMGVIGLLSLLVTAIAIRLVVVERRGRLAEVTPRRDEHDCDVMRDVMAIVSREDVRWLRQNDFGGPWEDDKLVPMARLVNDRNEVEHQFYDAELEERRQGLHAAIKVLLSESGQRAGINGHGRMSISAWDDLPSHRSPEERGARKCESREVINKAADEVVLAYDALVSRALGL